MPAQALGGERARGSRPGLTFGGSPVPPFLLAKGEAPVYTIAMDQPNQPGSERTTGHPAGLPQVGQRPLAWDRLEEHLSRSWSGPGMGGTDGEV
jgi:hypothetical protein